MAASLLPNGEQLFLDDDGVPLDGGLVYFYSVGTDQAKNTWLNPARTILNTNPVVLDAGGRAIIWGYGTYRQVLKNADGDTIWDEVTSDWGSPLDTLQLEVDELEVQVALLQDIINNFTSYIDTIIFNTPGDHIYEPSDGVTAIVIELLGGGAGSEGVASPGTGKVSLGAGGGGGEWVKSNLITTGIVSSTVHVGAGGAAGAGGNNPGLPGANSTAFAYTAIGGTGGTSSNDAVTPPVNNTSVAGGTGGTGPSIAIQTAGGPSGTELTQSTAAVSSGSGGSSHYGTGGVSATCTTDSSTAGIAGTGYGEGASGACASGTGAQQPGAAGGTGQIIIYEYGAGTGTVPVGTGAASQADEEIGTSTLVYTNPKVQQYHDSAVKAAALIDIDGTLLYGYNVASSTHLGDAGYEVTFTSPLGSANYVVNATAMRTDHTVNVSTQTATKVVLRTWRVIQSSGSEPHSSKVSMMVMGRLVASTYVADAVHFANAADEATNYIYRDTALLDVAASGVAVGSVWIKQATPVNSFSSYWAAGPTSTYTIGGAVDNSTVATDIAAASDASHGFNGDGAPASFTVDTWINVLFSWSTNLADGLKTMQIYQNDVSISPTLSDGSGAFEVPYATTCFPWGIGCQVLTGHVGTGFSFVGDMADFQFYPGVTLDLSVTANRRLFISATGKPVDPAYAVNALGEPALLFSGDATSFATNQGTAGDFTTFGTLTNATTSPSS